MIFRIVTDPSPKRVGLFRLEGKTPRKDWHVVAYGLTAEEVDRQIAFAKENGREIEDRRATHDE